MEPLAVEFANTRKRHGMEYVELLRDGADVAAWSAREPVAAVGARAAAARLEEIRAVRDDVFAVLLAAAAGEPVPADAAARLNERARRHPVVAQLGGAPVAVAALDPVDELLARVTAAAIELPTAGLGFCDAPSCGQFFIRERRDQRWCGPACGTRARVARHAARHRGAA
jgi:predicted RNA-binding Zn ribbon-like protein